MGISVIPFIITVIVIAIIVFVTKNLKYRIILSISALVMFMVTLYTSVNFDLYS